jgi:hypothetical protein
MADPISLDSSVIERFAYFDIEDGQLTIECNKCSNDDYMFSKTEVDTTGSTGWVARLGVHVTKHHSRVI